MYKKGVIVISLIAMLCSCNYFDFEKKERHVIATKQLEEIKASTPDVYPLLSPCEEETREASKKCFEEQIITHIHSFFEEAYTTTEDVLENDTIWVQIAVSKSGELTLKSIKKKPDYPNFDFVIEQLEKALSDISPIAAAQVHGIPVNSVFKLPLIIDNK